jgi:endonuclease/exonuclease/phosphatase family metal-dependent hydrolase
MKIFYLLLSIFTFVELNCENLFDTQHDSLKNDTEFLPDSYHYWNNGRYWKKLNHIGQEIIACGEDSGRWMLPDMVALCEIENDSVMRDLTRRSLLRQARYEYLVTNSPDERGVDVALLYSPFSFQLIKWYPIRITPIKDMRPTRDILYASGKIISGDTLHVFVVHAPSRMGGELASQPNRLVVARRLLSAVDSIKSESPSAKIIIAGDFNDYTNNKSLQYIYKSGMIDVSADAHGINGAKGTYKFKGEWGSLDHVLCSNSLCGMLAQCVIADYKFLLTDDDIYGGVQPFRNFRGAKYFNGYSDHLPLVAKFKLWK